MIKDLLVNLSTGTKYHAASAYAVSFAEAFEAHVTAIAFGYEPVVAVSVMGGMTSGFTDVQRAEAEQAANAARERFDTAARLAGIASDSHVYSTSVAGAADYFGSMARRFDLSIVMQGETDNAAAEDLIMEAALFQSGRPTIIVPYVHASGFKADRVMVCWDGGRTAARAIGDALPLLARASHVDVVMVLGKEDKRDEIHGADMGQHLARRGLAVEVRRIVADGDVQSTLLSYAADSSADMIVMGGYGHSRLREFILGGVTRKMLSAMTIPCFMSH